MEKRCNSCGLRGVPETDFGIRHMLTKLVNPLFSLSLQGTRLTPRGYYLGIFATPTRLENDSQDQLKGIAPGDVEALRKIRVRNLKNGEGFAVGDTVTSESGGVGVIESSGIDDLSLIHI